MPDPSSWIDSRLADTAPALVGTALLLAVLLAFLWRLFGRQEDRQDRRDARLSASLDNNTAALRQLGSRDDERQERHYEVLRMLGENCQTAHRAHDHDHAEMRDSLRRIEDRLGKV